VFAGYQSILKTCKNDLCQLLKVHGANDVRQTEGLTAGTDGYCQAERTQITRY